MEGGRSQLALVALALTSCLQAYRYNKRKKGKRRWARHWLARRSRNVFNNLLKEMCLEDSRGFFEFHRMSKANFMHLLGLVSPLIKKEDTSFRKSVSPALRLSVTLRYLATGESRRSLELQFRISHNLISSIIPEVCDALYTRLKDSYLKLPTTTSEWQKVASAFSSSWQFPNCIGALDGKRFLLVKPRNSGAESFDYKSHHSVTMLALVDAAYKFLYVDVATQGHASDADVWDKSKLKKYLEEKKLQVPANALLPYSNTQSPYVIVGDDTFPLKTYLMKPYSGKDLADDQRIFNYRLSRARRVSENAFGILASKFCVFQQPINSKPEYVGKLMCAAAVLHNFLRVNCKEPLPPEVLEREDIDRGMIISRLVPEAAGIERLEVTSRGHSNHAKVVRDNLKSYFISDGKTAWQERMVLQH